LYTGGIGVFSPQAQDVLVEEVRKLAEHVGRRLPETKNRRSKMEDRNLRLPPYSQRASNPGS
jgi:hypothetical protein